MGRRHRHRRPGVSQHPAQAPGQAAGGRRGAGRGRRLRQRAGERTAHDGGIRVGQPDRAPARGSRPAGGAGRRDLQPVCDPGLGRLARVLLQRRRRADRHPGDQRAVARQGLQAGRPAVARSGLQRRVHRRDRRRFHGPPHRALGRPRVHGVGRGRRPRRHAAVRGGLPAPRAGPGPARVRRAVRQLLPGVQPLHQRQGGRGRAEAARGRQDLRARRRAVAQVHRVRRRQGPGDAQGRRQLHLFRARRGLPHHQVGARLRPRREHPGHRPPRHHRPGAGRLAGGRRRNPAPVIPTMCCTPWCASCAAARK